MLGVRAKTRRLGRKDNRIVKTRPGGSLGSDHRGYTTKIEDFITPVTLPQAAEAILAADRILYY